LLLRGENQDRAVDALFSPVAHLVLGLKGAWICLDNFLKVLMNITNQFRCWWVNVGGEVADGGRGEEQPQPQDNNPPWFMADETRLVFGNCDQYDEGSTRSSQFSMAVKLH
jgi:hypothetical protein